MGQKRKYPSIPFKNGTSDYAMAYYICKKYNLPYPEALKLYETDKKTRMDKYQIPFSSVDHRKEYEFALRICKKYNLPYPEALKIYQKELNDGTISDERIRCWIDCAPVLKKEREQFESFLSGKSLMTACGIRRFSSLTQARLRRYYEIVDEVIDHGIPEDQAYRNIPKSMTMRSYSTPKLKDICIPIFSLKTESQIRKKMMAYIVDRCANNRPVDWDGLVAAQGISYKDMTDDQLRENIKSNVVEMLITSRRQKPNKNAPVSKPIIGGNGLNVGEHTVECSTAHRNILLKMVESGYGENEYAAFCIGMSWIAERLETVKTHQAMQLPEEDDNAPVES